MSYKKASLKHSDWLRIHEATLDFHGQRTLDDLRCNILLWTKRLIDSETVSFCDNRGGDSQIPWIELSAEADRVQQRLDPNPQAQGAMLITDFGRDNFADRTFFLHLWDTAPKVPHSEKKPIHGVQQFADYHTVREFRSTELYAECYAPVDQEMWCGHPLPGGTFTIALSRKGMAFQEKEVLIFDLLQPHIDQAYRRLLAQGETILPVAGHSEKLLLAGLTERESEVMHWLAEGKTNPEIACILSIGLPTVKTHVQKIFGKLGCETRTAAVRWFSEVNHR